VFCRLDGLMAGALLALVIRSESFVPSRFIRLAWFSFFIAAPLAFVSEFLNAGWILFSLTAVASAAFVYLSLFSSQRWLRIIFQNKFLVYTGTISYGLYLLHKIPIGFVESFRLDRHPFLALLLILVTAYAMATLSWNLLEKPFLRLKRYFEARPVMLDQVEAQISLKPEARKRD
jgi:peptidoglycan/LPS O-acetylase OafA/YrhL